MLRFVSQNMSSIQGIEWYPIFSLLLFVVFFAGVVYFTFSMGKNKIEKVGHLPFEADELTNTKNPEQ